MHFGLAPPPSHSCVHCAFHLHSQYLPFLIFLQAFELSLKVSITKCVSHSLCLVPPTWCHPWVNRMQHRQDLCTRTLLPNYNQVTIGKMDFWCKQLNRLNLGRLSFFQPASTPSPPPLFSLIAPPTVNAALLQKRSETAQSTESLIVSYFLLWWRNRSEPRQWWTIANCVMFTKA